MAGFTCPYCEMVMAEDVNTHRQRMPSFDSQDGLAWTGKGPHYEESAIQLDFYKCPNCGQYTVVASGKGRAVTDIGMCIKPNSLAKIYPEYIPQPIRADYEEACAVLQLSPKSSATLARRCLQGMIRDYWGISKGTLYAEVSELKGKIPADLWESIDSLRQLGNIGAHMEKDTSVIVDIDPDEAERLIQLIELLMKEWYIAREARKKLFGDILQINKEKQDIRKGEG